MEQVVGLLPLALFAPDAGEKNIGLQLIQTNRLFGSPLAGAANYPLGAGAGHRVPPVIGSAQPVVVGRLSGRPLSERTAR